MEAFHADRHVFERDERRGLSFVLALAMHALLVLFLFWAVPWRTQRVETVSVELWGSPPPAVETAPQPEPKPVPKVEPKPQPEPVPVKKPDIVEEKVKPKPVEKPKPQPASLPKVEIKKPEPKPEPKKEAAKKPEPKPSEFDKLMSGALTDLGKKSDAARPDGKPGGTGTNPKAAVNAGPGAGAGGGGRPGNDYLGQVVRLIKSNLVYPDNKPDNAKAKIKVFLLPDGTIRDAQLLKTVGDPAYAEAAKRAVMTTHTFPPQPGGKIFSGDMREWTLSFCAKDSGECRID